MIIPTPKDTPFFSVSLDLGGVYCTLKFSWNMRSGWYLALDADGEVVFPPRRLLPGIPLLYWVTGTKPPGELVFMAADGSDTPARFEDLGRTHALVYIEPS